jgi:hypothetical protein
MKSMIKAVPVFLAVFAISAHSADAQVHYSVGAGMSAPIGGDLKDNYGAGFTLRGQAGLSLAVAGVHLQTGWTTFSVSDDPKDTSVEDRFDLYHVAAGARVALGFFWVGANAAYFFGDGEKGGGLVPEVGFRVGPIEGVADGRLDGNEKWVSARLNLRF